METATDSAPGRWTSLVRPACGLTAALLFSILPANSWADGPAFRGTQNGAWANASAAVSTGTVSANTGQATRAGFTVRESSPSDQPAAATSNTKLKWRPVRGATGSHSTTAPRTNSQIRLTAGESEVGSTSSGTRYNSLRPDAFESHGPAARIAQGESRSVLGAQDPFEEEKNSPPQFTVPNSLDDSDLDNAFPAAKQPSTTQKVDPFGDDQPTTNPATQFPEDDFPAAKQPPQEVEPVEPMPRSVKKQTSPSDRTAEETSQVDPIDCEKGRLLVQRGGLDGISLSLKQRGRAGRNFPDECPLWDEQFIDRCWAETTYTWKASALCHKPLYFEDVQLERYGHEWGPFAQPVVSAAHFFGTLPILPYKMGLETPDECVYALGYYRPNSCAPYMIEPIGFTWRAALFEAGAVVGTAAVLP